LKSSWTHVAERESSVALGLVTPIFFRASVVNEVAVGSVGVVMSPYLLKPSLRPVLHGQVERVNTVKIVGANGQPLLLAHSLSHVASSIRESAHVALDQTVAGNIGPVVRHGYLSE
jgi:hypothetical protein